MEHLIIDAATLDLEEQVVSINRVAKVVKGGRNFRFSALVVVGDRQGHVGVGMSKALEVPEAIRKAVQDAKKHLVEVPIVDTTIPHEIKGIYGAGKVFLKPAPKGSGVKASAAIRAVCELAGIENISAKRLGSNNPRNIVNATINGLTNLKKAEDVAKSRGKSVEEILG